MPLRLIHLSDIHFRGYGGGQWDEDADQRSELLADMKDLVGPDAVDGIIVGGDIAFSAAPEEYVTARTWLDKVIALCRVDASRIWTVPGNHDVHRNTVAHSAAAQDFRRAVRACDASGIDRELRVRLSDDPAAEGVMLPFATYNSFASEFGCGTTARDPHWFDDSLSFDGVSVRLTGLNSALISDHSDTKDADSCKLVLGTWQCTLPRQDGLIHVAISHHPPEWLRDWEVVEPYLRRAHVVLFGHEHHFAAQQTEPEKTVYVYAGAVGPERLGYEAGDEYLPSWGFIRIEHCDGTLHVSVNPRVWHRRDTCFAEHPDGIRAFEVRVNLLEGRAGRTSEEEEEDKNVTQGMDASPLIPPPPSNMTGEPLPTPSERRRLGVRFSSLPPSRRLAIARALGVLEEPGDLELPTPKLYETILTRIRERNLIAQLEEEMERA